MIVAESGRTPAPVRPAGGAIEISEVDILAGHFRSTRDRAAATKGLILVLHDTTEFSYQRESEAIGITKSINSGRDDGIRQVASDRTRFAAS